MLGHAGMVGSIRQMGKGIPRRLVLPPPVTISWINGINNTEEDVKLTTKHLASAFDGLEVLS